MLEYEEYFRKFVISFQYRQDFEKILIDSSILGVFGNEFNMIALSLLFLRPLKCYSMHSIAFNVNTAKTTNYPIYLSLKDLHFTPIVPINSLFSISRTLGEHLNFINYDFGNLKEY
ncbi:unnamed protein product [Brachionus calyciflorus]|uniref:Uncharacterized protein n=1 Tax=Brachionus calyciflorus TaxID=104777 RepID=A0A814PJ24_9BILA|nr:unnamed protein product [Brachionus calyciflorus]